MFKILTNKKYQALLNRIEKLEKKMESTYHINSFDELYDVLMWGKTTPNMRVSESGILQAGAIGKRANNVGIEEPPYKLSEVITKEKEFKTTPLAGKK